ncbi:MULTISPECIES: carboxypeptidase-like regulatory domain-containing protein [Hymenobacter]|uniref:Carboxypeptidase-like regulatory domain-containing protein n=2 Tax=Hymenobacter TaxID=89966 RepID=A0ABS6WZ82_9BACT|nr:MULTISPECIES: carboxypeptidase-like regulatory domain-containing protein [Hymenobacter]MBO3271451.1 carboxypeptidase-like regulatory domain-containing protein [Hymenobacter defluvii]MBW3128053.1 carboxypeptidase-like regulatory domain-containing protein [Hymenobacter profundi]
MSVSSSFRTAFAGVITLLLLLLAGSAAQAQGKRPVVQFSGIIATGDSLLGVPGAAVFVPKAGRGTLTNEYGYFSLPVLAGDSIVIRALGYSNQWVVVPPDYPRQSYSIIIQLREDATILPEVRIFPYATEKAFKEAFLALRLPDEKGSSAAANLSPEVMRRLFIALPTSSMANYRQTMQMQQYDQQRRMGQGATPYTNNPLLNPFSWLQLINQIKAGEFKKKAGDDY